MEPKETSAVFDMSKKAPRGKWPRIAGGIIVLAVVFGLGAVYGRHHQADIDKVTGIINKQPVEAAVSANVDFAPFWKVWNILNERHVAVHQLATSTATSSASGSGANASSTAAAGAKSDEPTDQEKVWGAIQGLASSLKDPYTVFFPPVEAKNFAAEIRGNFEGVGMEIGIRDHALTVVAPLKGSPAERAGVRTGDKILRIDGKPSLDLPVDQAVGMIRGQKGTQVTLSLVREGKRDPLEVKITRDVIDMPTLDTTLRDDGVFVMRLYSFNAISNDLFRKGLQEFINSGSNKLILDLRGNPGGYLDVAVDMASWFLPKGAVVVREDFSTKLKKQEEEIMRSAGYDIFKAGAVKMVILVDGGSASASEILAGALSEHGIATLVGEKTFGKGSVQELVPITKDTQLKVTIARWLTPNGVSISERGITPSVIVKRTPEDVEKDRDPQLNKAVEILLKK